MDDLYGGKFRLFDKVRKNSAGLNFDFVDLANLDAFTQAITPKTKMVWIESPKNPLLKLVDLVAIAKLAKKHDILVVCDNTFATPYLPPRFRL